MSFLQETYQFDINRFGLLEQLFQQAQLNRSFEKLLNSKSTSTLIRDYFELLKQKKDVEDAYFNTNNESEKKKLESKLAHTQKAMEKLLTKNENASPVMVKILRTHLLIEVSMTSQGKWVMKAYEGDPDYKNKALPLIADLKELGLGIAWRLEAELQNEEQLKRESHLIAAQNGDKTANGLVGMGYLTYLNTNAQSREPYDYHLGPWIEPLDFMMMALDEADPETVLKTVAFMDNLCSVINDLSPERVAKNVTYQMRLKKDVHGPVEEGQILLEITPDKVFYTFLDDDGEEVNGSFIQDDDTYFFSEEYFDDEKSRWMPVIIQKINNQGTSLPPPYKQEFFDNKLMELLDVAKDVSQDKKLEKMIDGIQTAIEEQKYEKIPKKVKTMRKYISTTYAEKMNALITGEKMEAQIHAQKPTHSKLSHNLEYLLKLYEMEIKRIEAIPQESRTQKEANNLQKMKVFQQKVYLINQINSPHHALNELKNKVKEERKVIKQYPSSFQHKEKAVFRSIEGEHKKEHKQPSKGMITAMKGKLAQLRGKHEPPVSPSSGFKNQ